MKRLKSVENDQVQLEVIECDCGGHLGIDRSFLEQVGDFKINCPYCGTKIDTEVVCPEDDKDDKDEWIDKHSVNCYFCGKLFDERDVCSADMFNGNNGGTICPKCLINVLKKNID